PGSPSATTANRPSRCGSTMLCPTCTIWHDRGTNPEPVPPPLPARAKNMVLEARGGSGSEALAGLHVAPEFVQHCPTTMTLLADLGASATAHPTAGRWGGGSRRLPPTRSPSAGPR